MKKIKIVKHLVDKGFPTSSKRYQRAHNDATRAETKKFGKQTKSMRSMEIKAGKHKELLAKETRGGKIEEEQKLPKSMRRRTTFHEECEHKKLQTKKRK